LPAIQQWGYPTEKYNTEDILEGFVFTFIVDSQNQDNTTKAQSGRFSKYVFLLQCVAGNS